MKFLLCAYWISYPLAGDGFFQDTCNLFPDSLAVFRPVIFKRGTTSVVGDGLAEAAADGFAVDVPAGVLVAAGAGVLVGFAVGAAAGVFSGFAVEAVDGVWDGFEVPHQSGGVSAGFSSGGRIVKAALFHPVKAPFPFTTA